MGRFEKGTFCMCIAVKAPPVATEVVPRLLRVSLIPAERLEY